MASRSQADALSRERIVAAAVQLLDLDGEAGLTFRALSARLRTGPGAIYWHVANKDELLVAATDTILASTVRAEVAGETPREVIRAVAAGVFDAIDAHPWVGAQLSRTPAQPALRRILERIGQQLTALGVPAGAYFVSVSALLNYVLGVGGQNAAQARAQQPGADRTNVLKNEARVWENLDPAEFPFLREVAAQLRGHDDREVFLAGVDLILDGITVSRG